MGKTKRKGECMNKILSTIAFTALLFLFSACSTIKESTETSTTPVTVPAVAIHDTLLIPVELPMREETIDSIGRWYLDNYCKGTVDVDKDGMKATINFWTKTTKRLADSLDTAKKTVIQLGYEIQKKEQIIQATKTVTTTESTPGQFWIWTHSFLFQFIAFALGVTAVIILQMKMKFIP
jgi:hypothetical protein